MSNEERYREALEKISLNVVDDNITYEDLANMAKKALYPKPQYEDVEICDAVWQVICVNPNAMSPNFKGIFYDKKRAEDIIASASFPDDFLLLEATLTATYKREIKPKVKRRERISADVAQYHETIGHAIFTEWEE